MGINVNLTISVTFAIGSALAAIAGVLLCSAYPTLHAHHRLHAGHQGLHGGGVRRHRVHPRRHAGRHAAGRHRNPGARPTYPRSLATPFVFAVLIVVLLVKPAGLLGKTVHEKV